MGKLRILVYFISINLPKNIVKRFWDFVMRIDKFLKVSRILKRRTVAQEACDAGKVTVNGKEAKPSHRIKEGDVVEIVYRTGSVKFQVKAVKECVKKDEAADLYEILE